MPYGYDDFFTTLLELTFHTPILFPRFKQFTQRMGILYPRSKE
ncbi:hypothetical protein HMPREF9374_3143 [Desmospora sp. 8437]|nr:hypothetical protein HMPREF9374_3143 [Desmospora sp. 8437]